MRRVARAGVYFEPRFRMSDCNLQLAEPNPAGLVRNCPSSFAVREAGAPSPNSQAVIRTRAPRQPRMAKLFDGHRLSEIARLVDVGSQDKRSVVCKKLQRQREDERCYEGRHVLKGQHCPGPRCRK
jgi:hypothetical protein